MTIDEALIQLASLTDSTAVSTTRIQTVPVEQSFGRVLAQNITSPVPVPGFANSAMDGYAVRFADLDTSSDTVLKIQGESLAGHPFDAALQAHHAVRIFTGAALPPKADTIVIQENTSPGSTDSTVIIHSTGAKGSYVRPIGHDVAQDSLLFSKGTRMRAFEIASATTSGLSELPVFEPLRIGVFATGDELKTPGTTLQAGEIYESNRVAIRSLLRDMPLEITDLGILPDEPDATRQALALASNDQDALITSGGVSVGDADFVKDAISELGGIDFWRLNLRPGKPFAFGHLLKPQSDAKCLIFGLPGNPVSTIVTLLLLVKPTLWRIAGHETYQPPVVRVPLAGSVSHSVGRHEYQRGRLEQTDAGAVVKTTSDQSSNRLQSFAGANCLFLVPGDVEHLATGELVEVLPFEGLI